MPTPLSSALGSARRATYVLTSSNASFPIPAWAQGGKGIALVSGVGAGGAGGGRDTNGSNGSPLTGGGGSGAWCVDYPMHIPSGVTTVAVQIGSGGIPGTNDADGITTNNAGGDGGATSLTVGLLELRLGGGRGGRADGTLVNGVANGGSGGQLDDTLAVITDLTETRLRPGFSGTASNGSQVFGPFPRVLPSRNANSAGASSFFGRGGQVNNAGAGATAPVGYGGGGHGANNSGNNASAGAPGILILTFMEGL